MYSEPASTLVSNVDSFIDFCSSTWSLAAALGRRTDRRSDGGSSPWLGAYTVVVFSFPVLCLQLQHRHAHQREGKTEREKDRQHHHHHHQPLVSSNPLSTRGPRPRPGTTATSSKTSTAAASVTAFQKKARPRGTTVGSRVGGSRVEEFAAIVLAPAFSGLVVGSRVCKDRRGWPVHAQTVSLSGRSLQALTQARRQANKQTS